MIKTNQTLDTLYNSMLKTLVERRTELIQEIEEINHQIVEIKNEAKESGVTLAN